MMLIIRLAAFLLPLLLYTTTASVLGTPQLKDLRAIHARDVEGKDAIPRSNGNSVSQRNGMAPSVDSILFREALSRSHADHIFLRETLIIARYSCPPERSTSYKACCGNH